MSDHWYESCEECGQLLEVGLWTCERDRCLCTPCQIELDSTPRESISNKMPTPDDCPELHWPERQESERQRLERYTREDHDWMTDHPYWGRKPIDRPY